MKAAESESKLKQVYIPSYNKPNPNLLSGKLTEAQMGGRPCEGCGADKADSWYAWGPVQLQCRLCKFYRYLSIQLIAFYLIHMLIYQEGKGMLNIMYIATSCTLQLMAV